MPLGLGTGIGLSRMSKGFVPSKAFPSNIASYDADFVNDQYSNFAVTNTGGFATGGFDIVQQLTAVQPNFSEMADGSLKTFSAQYWTRRTNRGLVVEPPRTNVVLQNRDLTNASWTKGGAPTVAKTGTGRTGVANSCSRVTLTGAQATFTQAITLTSSSRRMQIEAKRVTGTPTGRISFDGGVTYTAINFTTAIPGAGSQSMCKTKTAPQTVTNPTVIIEINGTAGDVVLIDFVECINDVAADGITIPEVAPVATTTVAVTATGDRAAGYTTATPASNMAIFMRDQPIQVHYFEFWMMSTAGEVGLIASDAGMQLRARNATGTKASANGTLSTTDPLVTADYHNPVWNKMLCGFTPTESFICLNGDTPVVGAGFALNPATTHFDEGTNGAQLLRLNGGAIGRQFGSIKYAAAKAVAQKFTT
jgi:hypothetical protein